MQNPLMNAERNRVMSAPIAKLRYADDTWQEIADLIDGEELVMSIRRSEFYQLAVLDVIADNYDDVQRKAKATDFYQVAAWVARKFGIDKTQAANALQIAMARVGHLEPLSISELKKHYPMKSVINHQGCEYLICGYITADGSWLIDTSDHHAIQSGDVQGARTENQTALIVWSEHSIYEALPVDAIQK